MFTYRIFSYYVTTKRFKTNINLLVDAEMVACGPSELGRAPNGITLIL